MPSRYSRAGTWHVPEYAFPTYEACEIHSMSMEFFAWPWMELFFEEDAAKYRFNHLATACIVHSLRRRGGRIPALRLRQPGRRPRPSASKPGARSSASICRIAAMTATQYLEQGRLLAKAIAYLPFAVLLHRLYVGSDLRLPVLETVERGSNRGMDDYLRLCRQAEAYPSCSWSKLAGLISPFEDGCIGSVIGEIEGWLNGIDDKAL